MAPTPDEFLWVQQARILRLCEISRATLNSWIKSGLDLDKKAASYGFSDLVTLLIFSAARDHMTPQHMVSAWNEMVESGEATRITNAARELEPDAGFDLVVDPEHADLKVTLSETELLEAVRHPTTPRPVVVVDMAERVRDKVSAFHRFANREERPAARKRGRPRNASRGDSGLRLVGGEGS